MAGDYDSWGFTQKTWYTFDEAIEYMRIMDKGPTTRNISWEDSNGNPVTIAYVDHKSKRND